MTSPLNDLSIPDRYRAVAATFTDRVRGSVDWDFPTSVLDVVLMGRYGHLGWFRRPGRADRVSRRPRRCSPAS